MEIRGPQGRIEGVMSTQAELSVIVPCFNEEGNLPNLVARLDETMSLNGIKAEIVLVDDCSRDRTRSVIQDLATRHSFVKGVYHDPHPPDTN